ncbi:MAG: CPBP family glutamic-type intramembrane protease [Candidatus Binatia bacterium]
MDTRPADPPCETFRALYGGKRGLLVESLLVLVATLVLALWLRSPALWFVLPFAVITLTRRPYEPYGLTWKDPGSVGFHIRTALVVFGGYALLYCAFASLALGRHFVPTLPPNLAEAAFVQLVVVGLCEEFFFRGYLQTQLNAVYGRPYRFLGAQWGRGLIYAALLFGLCHIVTGDLSRMRVFFFGLFAGWLRERTGTIAVPAAYHGFANLLQDVLGRSMVEP